MLHHHWKNRLGQAIAKRIKKASPNTQTPPPKFENLEPRLLMAADVIISELMYHSAHVGGENTNEEWIELFNRGDEPADMSAWAFTEGIDFTIPANTTLNAGEHLIIAADLATFNANYPAVTNAIGGWTGKLSNSGEEIKLEDALGDTVDRVDYADQGDWSQRILGPDDLGHRGVEWNTLADGGGHSLEVIKIDASNNYGLNWADSTNPGGTPGAANTAAQTDVAPYVLDVDQSIAIPSSAESVTITAEVLDVMETGVTATLHYRADGDANFVSVPMTDQGGDEFTAEIPAMPDGTIVEFYTEIEGNGLTRTSPAPVDVDGVLEQRANYLYQVMDQMPTFTAGDHPTYLMIMTAADRAELADIQDNSQSPSNEADTNAQFNATFMVVNGGNIDVEYETSVRNRGNSSRTGPPNNFRVNFKRDNLWNGLESININGDRPDSQLLGHVVFKMAGLTSGDAIPVEILVNGVDPAIDTQRQNGSFVRIEALDSDFARNHFPNDSNGNLYRMKDADEVNGPSDLGWEGNDPDDYRDTYFKQTNASADDWSDLINLLDVLNNTPDETFVQEVSQVIDIEQWMRYIALDSLLGNREGGLTSGRGDDFAMYRGEIDTRFKLIPHDLDTLLGFDPSRRDPGRSIFSGYDSVNGLSKLLSHPDTIGLYYQAFMELINDVFNPQVMNPLIDRMLGGWVTQGEIDDAKDFVTERITSVMSQITGDFSINVPVATLGEFAHTTNDSISITGTADPLTTRAIRVNGTLRIWDSRSEIWSATDINLNPGVNRIIVETYDNTAGIGDALLTEFVDIWYDDGNVVQVSGDVSSTNQDIGNLVLDVRDSYMPGVPILVQVEAVDDMGNRRLDLWDATATITTNDPNVQLSESTVTLYNGVGSVLVTVTGTESGGGETIQDTLLPTGSVWSYLDDGSDQGTAWRAQGFDDSLWASGPAQLGYGDGDEDTEVGFIDTDPVAADDQKNATTYFRTSFDLAATPDYDELILNLQYDDGAAVYINGVEVVRENLDANAAFDEFANDAIAGADEDTLFEFRIPADMLVQGTNTIAVEVHQRSDDSSDISFDLSLIGEKTTGSQSTSVTPIDFGAVWNYLDDGSDQATAWRNVGFDDSTWESGPAQLGYGDGDEDTEVDFIDTDGDGSNGTQKNATTYFRRTFDVVNADTLDQMVLDLIYDDAAAIYVNGIPVGATNNFPTGAPFNQFADGDSPGDDAEAQFIINPNMLVDGENTIAVEIKQGDDGSSDISFDLRMTLNDLPEVEDPGDFTLSATIGSTTTSKPLTSLFETAQTDVSGTINTDTTWSGVVHVTGDLTIADGVTLTIDPGTLVLIDGTSTPLSENATQFIVEGAVNAIGTAQSPITFTATDPNAAWGWLLHNNAEPSTYNYVNITRAGHSDRMGHTNTGPAVRPVNSTISFFESNITNIAGKIMQSASGSDITFIRGQMARASMGPELFGTALLFEDSHISEMLSIYREDGIDDDNDGIYLHTQNPGQDIILRNSVFANGGDDAIDTLGSTVLAEDLIVRDWVDKGMSINRGETTVRRSLFTDNDIGISAKTQGDVSTVANIDQVTSVGNNWGIRRETDGNGPAEVFVTNSIVTDNNNDLDADGVDADLHVDYTLFNNAGWSGTGTGNITGDPLFVGGTNFHLVTGSPAIDAGDPNAPLDDDGSITDMGAFPFMEGDDVDPEEDTIIWTAAAGPYHLTADAVVPAGKTLIIEPGTSVYIDEGFELLVEGILIAEGTQYERIRFTAVPNAPLVPDRPAGNTGLPDGPPRWAGIHFEDSMSDQNLIAFADIEYAQSLDGSIGNVRSELVIDNVTFRGMHLRMYYGDDSNVIIQNSYFPDMFAENESPAAIGLDNISEHIKGVGRAPAGGHIIIRNNVFGTNKGHNDVVDHDSGIKANGEVVMQVIGNVFMGSGDEQLDLGGDVYVEGNLFSNIFKDQDTSDRGYANAMSTGDAGANTTIVVARNYFWDVDHAVNLKRDAATIFEYNTVVNIHDDFIDRFGDPNVGGAIVFYVDEAGATTGDGAYVEGNIFWDVPRVLGNVDQAGSTTRLEMKNNLIDPATPDLSIEDRPETVLTIGVNNILGNPRFVNELMGDFALAAGSQAIGASEFGVDWGATAPAGAWIANEPGPVTASDSASLLIGGAGIFAYQYRINGGAWSETIDIGVGFDPDGPQGTVRTDTLELTGLADGTYTVEVLGQNFAGAWQETPTASRTWTVNSTYQDVVINEILANNVDTFDHEGTNPDVIELYNPSGAAVDLGGMFLTDDIDNPTRFQIPANTIINPGEYLLVFADSDVFTTGIHTGFGLDAQGDSVHLFDTDGLTRIDGFKFGNQLNGFTLGRIGFDGNLQLNNPTLGTANDAALTGDTAFLHINEWLAAGDIRFADDFIEFYNEDTLPVDMGGMFITDQAADEPDKFQVREHHFIAGQGFLKFEADDNEGQGPTHVNFSLGRDHDHIGAFNFSGELIDQVLYINQDTDVSQGLLPDGSDNIVFFDLPTPNASNGSDIDGNLTNIINDLRITEIHYHPKNPNGNAEFIELKNTGSSVLELEGVRLTDAMEFTFPTMSLNPGEFVILAHDLGVFEFVYGTELNALEVDSGALSNGGEVVVLRLPEPFDAAILRFDYEDDWYPQTDGGGYSLVTTDETQHIGLWDRKEGWRSGYRVGGSPGADDLPETVPPQVALAVFDNQIYPQAQILFDFSEFVGHTLTLDDITVFNNDTQQFIDPANLSFTYNTQLQSATVAFLGLPGETPEDGNYTMTISSTGVTDLSGNTLDGNGDGTPGDDYSFTFDVTTGDTTPPTVISTTFSDVDPDTITVVFSEDVNGGLLAVALTLFNTSTSITIDPADMDVQYDSGSFTATISFPGLTDGHLPGGFYDFTLIAAGIQDPAGNILDGNDDGTPGDDYTAEIAAVISGDANFDDMVNLEDLAKLATNFGQSGKTWAEGDFTDDGIVDLADLAKLATFFGQSRIPEPAGAGASDSADLLSEAGSTNNEAILTTSSGVSNTSSASSWSHIDNILDEDEDVNLL